MSRIHVSRSDQDVQAQPIDPAKVLTYSREIESAPKRLICRALEAVTGQRQLARRAKDYHLDYQRDQDFWKLAFERLESKIVFGGEGLEGIPQEGPLVMVANHPFGVIDGLAFGYTLSRRRKNFKILTNSALCQVPEISDHLLPISFEQSKEAVALNLETRRIAMETLIEGGAIGVFPGGTVSTSAHWYGRAIDPEWKTFTAKMITKSNACVIPLYFEGQNSRVFQILSHISQTLRLAFMINELKRGIGRDVQIQVGKPIAPERLQELRRDPQKLMEFLRLRTYALSGLPLSWKEYGWPHKPAKAKLSRAIPKMILRRKLEKRAQVRRQQR